MSSQIGMVGGSAICSLVSAAIACIGGCSVYHTSVNEGDTSSRGEGAVLTHGALQPYFLPRGFVRLEIKETSKSEKADEPPKTTPAGDASASADTEPDSGKTAADTKPTGKRNNDATPTTPAEPTLPDMPVTDVAAAWSGTRQVHIRLTTILAPDYRRGPIYSRFVGNALSHDQPKLDVNERHLLSSTVTTTEDKSAQIISDLTDTTINVLKTMTMRMAPAAQKEAVTEPIDIDITFDPMDFAAVHRVSNNLSGYVHEHTSETLDLAGFIDIESARHTILHPDMSGL